MEASVSLCLSLSLPVSESVRTQPIRNGFTLRAVICYTALQINVESSKGFVDQMYTGSIYVLWNDGERLISETNTKQKQEEIAEYPSVRWVESDDSSVIVRMARGSEGDRLTEAEAE